MALPLSEAFSISAQHFNSDQLPSGNPALPFSVLLLLGRVRISAFQLFPFLLLSSSISLLFSSVTFPLTNPIDSRSE